MKWYPYLYVGEGASKKKNKIIRKLKIGAGMIDVWVITEAANGEDQFDIPLFHIIVILFHTNNKPYFLLTP